MKPITRKIAIWEIANKVNEYVRERDLFRGGCCFAAYVLSDIFTRLGIRYRTVLYQDLWAMKMRRFNTVINSNCCSHVAIEVVVDGKWTIIGDCSDLVAFYNKWSMDYTVRRYKNISPIMLADAYFDNEWNDTYDIENNGFLEHDLYEIMEKYAKVPR